ncbi:conserved exported hypothetical protein [Candidatus Desulfarcum epimagneticum]|uniref:Outer membrane protein beta-barrel domain-containing protein n=1 Tax=uncultured Desulfobacteraceae bacterium TaxID=218296 RepID=A0A484HIU8_9BACT|nr:conserved exported hypothetical protein [uncultured Desulfobacteraceae bacterium]
MRKKIIGLILMSAALALICQPAFAAGPGGKFGLGARFTLVDSMTHNSTTGTINSDIEAETYLGYSVNATYYIWDFLSVELDAGYAETKLITANTSTSNLGTEYGWLKQFPILMTLRFMIPTGTNWYPYVGVGGGYHFNDFKIDESYAAVHSPPDVNVENSFSYHANAGFECFVTPSTAINLDMKYTWHEIDFENSAPSAVKEEAVDMDGLSVGGGLKYFF